MGNTSVKPAGSSNEGLTDMDRGSKDTFSASKAARKTGKVGTATSVPNDNTEDSNKRVVNDPRLS